MLVTFLLIQKFSLFLYLQFEIRFNDFKIIIVGATLVSVLITLNVILSRRKKEREKIMEEFMQEINMNNENKEKSKQYIKNKK